MDFLKTAKTIRDYLEKKSQVASVMSAAKDILPIAQKVVKPITQTTNAVRGSANFSQQFRQALNATKAPKPIAPIQQSGVDPFAVVGGLLGLGALGGTAFAGSK